MDQLKSEMLSENHFKIFVDKIQSSKFNKYSKRIVLKIVGKSLKKYWINKQKVDYDKMKDIDKFLCQYL